MRHGRRQAFLFAAYFPLPRRLTLSLPHQDSLSLSLSFALSLFLSPWHRHDHHAIHINSGSSGYIHQRKRFRRRQRVRGQLRGGQFEVVVARDWRVAEPCLLGGGSSSFGEFYGSSWCQNSLQNGTHLNSKWYPLFLTKVPRSSAHLSLQK